MELIMVFHHLPLQFSNSCCCPWPEDVEDKIPPEAYKHCEGQHQACGAAVPDTTKR